MTFIKAVVNKIFLKCWRFCKHQKGVWPVHFYHSQSVTLPACDLCLLSFGEGVWSDLAVVWWKFVVKLLRALLIFDLTFCRRIKSVVLECFI